MALRQRDPAPLAAARSFGSDGQAVPPVYGPGSTLRSSLLHAQPTSSTHSHGGAFLSISGGRPRTASFSSLTRPTARSPPSLLAGRRVGGGGGMGPLPLLALPAPTISGSAGPPYSPRADVTRLSSSQLGAIFWAWPHLPWSAPFAPFPQTSVEIGLLHLVPALPEGAPRPIETQRTHETATLRAYRLRLL